MLRLTARLPNVALFIWLGLLSSLAGSEPAPPTGEPRLEHYRDLYETCASGSYDGLYFVSALNSLWALPTEMVLIGDPRETGWEFSNYLALTSHKPPVESHVWIGGNTDAARGTVLSEHDAELLAPVAAEKGLTVRRLAAEESSEQRVRVYIDDGRQTIALMGEIGEVWEHVLACRNHLKSRSVRRKPTLNEIG